MAGVDNDYRGEAQLKPGATVGLLEQEPQLDESKDVRGNVEDGVRELRDLVDRYNEVAANYSDETADEFARLQDQIDAADAWNLDTMLDTAMDALRLPPGDADVTKLSGGERRRVALCRLLLSAPDLLLLDEPTNHLDAESVAWLERHLEEYKGAVVAVTHDRYFLDNVAGWILELDRGRGIPFQGNYSSWLEQKTERLAQEKRTDKARAKTLAAELEWVRENPKGRRKKSKARLARYEALLAEDRNVKLDDVQIHIPAGPRLGDKVIEAEGLQQGLRRAAADRRPLVLAAAGRDRRRDRPERRRQDDAVPDDRRRREARLGLRCELGETVELAYVDQSPRRARPGEDRLGGDLRGLRPDQGRRPRDELARLRLGLQLQGLRPAAQGRHALGRRAQPRPPGEAAALGRQPAAARRADQRPRRRHAARARGGAARLRRLRGGHLPRPLVPRPVATHVLAFEGDSKVVWFEGNFEAYEENRRERLGAAADRPHRITYKKLVAR